MDHVVVSTNIVIVLCCDAAEERKQWCVVAGVEHVISVTGYFCKLCHKFYNNETMARITHCKSQSHFNKYLVSRRHGLTDLVTSSRTCTTCDHCREDIGAIITCDLSSCLGFCLDFWIFIHSLWPICTVIFVFSWLLQSCIKYSTKTSTSTSGPSTSTSTVHKLLALSYIAVEQSQSCGIFHNSM